MTRILWGIFVASLRMHIYIDTIPGLAFAEGGGWANPLNIVSVSANHFPTQP